LLILFVQSAMGAHITDKLVVGLYPEPVAEGTPLQLLSSGTPLEVLERRDGFARVRLADDVTGWVEADYVTEEKPAKAMLLETQAKLRQMGLELAALRERAGSADTTAAGSEPPALEEARARIAELEAQLAARDEALSAGQLAALNDEVRAVVERLAATQDLVVKPREPDPHASFFSRYLTVIVATLALALGFVLGIAVIDYRIRRRYGGFRL
jgi:SH3 domain protein